VRLDDATISSADHLENLLALEQALARLASFDERRCRILEMRFFRRNDPGRDSGSPGHLGTDHPPRTASGQGLLRQQLTLK